MDEPQADVPIRVRAPGQTVRGANRTYVQDVRIGRSRECEVQVEDGKVSRVHASLLFEDGRWWIVDDDSTNGTYLDGEPVDRVPLPADAEVQLGENGPVLNLVRPEARATEKEAADTARSDATTDDVDATRSDTAPVDSDASAPAPGRKDRSEVSDASVSQYVRHYFTEEDESAGEHTRMLRQAYQRVQKKERRQYIWMLAGALALCVVLGGYAVVQHMRNERLQGTAQELFVGMKEQKASIAQLRRRIEEQGGASLQQQLATLREQHRKQQERYEGFVKELGLYRELSAREQEIYQTARIFGESELSIPAGFVRKVNATIENYWKGPARGDYINAIERAEENGYTSFIVQAMRKHGLPPEFFYLALQESRLRVKAVGPETRWGIAKGMWQFIPSTARKYGLQLGPRVDTRVYDSQDERHHFKKSTRAAARYLQTIYSTDAQASGLLVVASYNWGEHRVVDRLEQLPGPQSIPEEALQDIPESPEERSYWQFLTEYSDRMPAETKDYVLKVFSAAVIGRNPELFGFDFENPLKEHMESSPTTEPVS